MLKNTFLKLKNRYKVWRKACDSSAFKGMKKAKFYCNFRKKKKMENFCQPSSHIHIQSCTHTHTHTPASLWMNHSLSLNWWSDKVGLNSRRRGTHSPSGNMCFTSGAPSYTRANVSICTDVCVCMPIGLIVCVCVCVSLNRSATCLCNLLSAFNLYSAENGKWREGGSK